MVQHARTAKLFYSLHADIIAKQILMQKIKSSLTKEIIKIVVICKCLLIANYYTIISQDEK